MITIGLTPEIIEVEVDLSNGLPSFTIVGLADTAIQEAKERTRSAIRNSDLHFPTKKITANLAPADIRKSGPSFDLPLAVGILLASEQVEKQALFEDSLFVGELSLNGNLRHTNGILPIASEAIKKGFKRIFLPAVNAKEAALINDLEVYGVENLRDLVEFFWKERKLDKTPPIHFSDLLGQEKYEEDFAYIKGQEHAKRAMEIAAAGSHNILMNGAPGAGKTLMAQAFRTILPQITEEEAFEVSKIFSVANLLPEDKPLLTTRPFRTVHHTASDVSIVGGGKIPRPGEISLAHKGVLFLDELSEFPTQVLEVLRQPLEDRHITISRAHGSIKFPAHFILIGAMNPCPCGFYGVLDATKECTCNSAQISRHKKKISGPLLDRMDLFVDISPVKFEKLTNKTYGEKSEEIQKRVQKARNIQQKRFENDKILTNAEMNVKQVEKHCPICDESSNLLRQAMHQFNLSARGFHRVLKVARTIADLDDAENISLQHIAEALQFRPRFEE